MGRLGYPAEFRRKVLDLLAEGRSVASVAYDLEISDQTIYTWRRQDRIDRGEIAGVKSAELAELALAKKRIAELETELAVALHPSWVGRRSSLRSAETGRTRAQ